MLNQEGENQSLKSHPENRIGRKLFSHTSKILWIPESAKNMNFLLKDSLRMQKQFGFHCLQSFTVNVPKLCSVIALR